MTSTLDKTPILDSFDEAWASGQIPRLDDYLVRLRRCNDLPACLGICAVDLEWRWRTFFPSGQLPQCYRAETYVQRYADLFTTQLHYESLLESEWLARSRWGDEPIVDDFISFKNAITTLNGSFSEREKFRLSLVLALDELGPLVTSVHRGHSILRFICPPEYEIGRRKKSDPRALAWMEPQRRLVVTHERELTVSRKQLTVRRIRLSEVEIVNVSKKVSITIGQEELEPGERARIETPFSIQMLDITIVIEAQ